MNKMEIKIRKRLTFHCIYHLHFQVQLELEQSVTTSGGASDQQMFTFYYQPSRSRRKQTGKMESLLQTISVSGAARCEGFSRLIPNLSFCRYDPFQTCWFNSDIIKISQRRLCIQQPASELTYNWDGGWLQDCNMIIFQTQEASSPLIGFIYASRFHLPIASPLASNNFLRSHFSNCQFWHLNLDRI